MPKIIIAAQAFKGTLTSFQACQAIQEGIHLVRPSVPVQMVPVADGGDDSLEILAAVNHAKRYYTSAFDAYGTKRQVPFAYSQQTKTAIIAFSDICGLASLDPIKRNPFIASTYGVGEVILAALDMGCEKCILCLGGSATNDAGTGLAAALGMRMLDKKDHKLPLGGGYLSQLAHIDFTGLDSRVHSCQFTAACDVENPLIGPRGASLLYSPQKGASLKMAEELEAALKHFATIVLQQTGQDISMLPRGGAAGGSAAGIAALLKGKLIKGSDLILDSIDFDAILEGCNLVITGEGKMDRQTQFGKAPLAVAQRAKKKGIKVIAIVGSLGEGYEQLLSLGIDRVFCLPKSPKSAFEVLKDFTKTNFYNLFWL